MKEFSILSFDKFVWCQTCCHKRLLKTVTAWRQDMKKIIWNLNIVVICVLLMSGCSLFGGKDKVTPTPIPTVAATSAPTATSVPTATSTVTPTVTPTILTPTVGPTKTPTPEPMTGAEATNILDDYIDATIYTISTPELIYADDGKYYWFRISDADKVYSPDILVEAYTGVLYYYDTYSTISEFISFPPDNVEVIETTGDIISQDQAISLLRELSTEELGLPSKLSAYMLTVDTWSTLSPDGNECYTINVFKGQDVLVGVYYVTYDGTSIYKNVEGDFELIK